MPTPEARVRADPARAVPVRRRDRGAAVRGDRPEDRPAVAPGARHRPGWSPRRSPRSRSWNWTGDRHGHGRDGLGRPLLRRLPPDPARVAAMGLLLGTHYFARSGDASAGEFYPLVLFATAGMTLITAAADLILVFLSLEILSLSLYVLTGITGRRDSNEAAMKYFLLGAFSSAFFLFGVAWRTGRRARRTSPPSRTRSPGRPGDQASRLARVRVPRDRVRRSRCRRCRSTCGPPTSTRARPRR